MRGGRDDPGGGDDAGGEAKPFAGMRFKLFGFSPDVETKYTAALESGGAIPSKFFGVDSGCSHLIVSTYDVNHDNDWCTKGAKGGAAVVNDLWLDHCLKQGQLIPAGKVMYKPFVRGGILVSLKLQICCSGYQHEKLQDIQRMVHLIGGNFHEKWSRKATHAICNMFDGEIYEKANERGIPIVNHSWLSDSLNAGVILPYEKYCVPGQEVQQCEDNFKRAYEHLSETGRTEIRSNLSGAKTPDGRSISIRADRLTQSTGNKKLRVETNFISKPKIVRSLQFKSDEKTSLDNYVKPDKRVVSIVYPDEEIPRDLTAPVLKRVLRKSYLPLGRLHAENLSLGGNFSCHNFMVSDPHETVELCNVITEKLTPEGRKADKKAFVKMVKGLFEWVPRDVRVWLHDIEGGWDDALLMNHIYMLDSDLTYGHFITLYQGVLKLKEKGGQKYKDFIELPSMQPYNSWHTDGFKWKVLDANKDYTDPREEQLDILEKARLELKREKDPSRNNVFGLLKTVRNTWSHPAAHLLEFFLAIMITEYLQLLSDLQKALYDCGYYGQNLSLKDFP
ncbi:hypothetical protein ACQJBY_007597 [Aegilops geniculata]